MFTLQVGERREDARIFMYIHVYKLGKEGAFKI